MAKSESLELPEFLKALSKELRPKRPSVNRLVFPSPLKEWPGTVTTPCYLSAEEYHVWWTSVGDGQPEEDKRNWAFHDWETRFHFAKAWNIEGLDNDQLKQDPVDIPDMRFIMWFLTITNPIIQEATSLPNSQGPSSAITTI